MSQSSESRYTSAKIGIVLGSLACFSIIAFGILSIFELIAREWNIFQGNIFHIILPYGIFLWSGMFLVFCLTCAGGWLYLKNQTPEHPGTLKAFIVITGVCSLILPPLFLYITTYVPMMISIVFPGMYLLFTQVFPKDGKYVLSLKYFAGGVAVYNFLIGFVLTWYILFIGSGTIPASLLPLCIFAIGSTLALLPVLGFVFIAVGWHTLREGS